MSFLFYGQLLVSLRPYWNSSSCLAFGIC